MNITEYKALMMLELLMCNHDLSNHNYAAVDEDGELCVYILYPETSGHESYWYPCGSDDGYFITIGTMKEPDNYREAIIQI